MLLGPFGLERKTTNEGTSALAVALARVRRNGHVRSGSEALFWMRFQLRVGKPA